MSKVQEAVSNLLGEVNKRNAKIQEKINVLKENAAVVKSSIDELIRDLVNFDLADDEQGQSGVNKKIAQLRSKYDDLQARITAYQGALNDPEFIKSEISNIVILARKEKENRHESLRQKTAQREKLESDLKKLKERIESTIVEIRSLIGRQEAKDLIPLLKYIEARPIKRGSEDSYLSAYLDGLTGESLDQYIEVPIDYSPSAMSVGKGPSINWGNSSFTKI